MKTGNLRYRVSLFLAFVSGVAALAHETLWTRRLVDVLGASAETFAKVVGSFFLGLALGAWCAARWPRNSWRGVAIAESLVGLLAVPILFSPQWSAPLFANSDLAFWMRIILPVGCVVPPALAMGLVLPWLLGALAREEKQSAAFAVWIYGANTFGGIAGIALVLLSPVPALGLTWLGLIVCGINLTVAVAALILSKRQAGSVVGELPTEDLSKIERRAPAEYFLAFVSGFLVLWLEVVLQHQFAQVTINSQFSGGAVLALVLLGLGIAAILLPPLVRKIGADSALSAALVAAAACAAAEPCSFTALRHGVDYLPYELTIGPYTMEILKLGAATIVPLFVVTGLVFPLLLRYDTGRAGRLLAWNGLGGWLGTEFAQNIVSPVFGMWQSVEIVAATYFLLWVAVAHRQAMNPWIRLSKAGLGLAAVLIGFFFARHFSQVTILPGEHLAAIRAGREGVVATVECAPDDWRILYNNSYTLGGSKAQFNQERQGLLPLLIHGNPKSAATLGVATGGTVAGVSLYPGVGQIDAIELSPLVLQQARQFFAPYDRNIFHDPRVHFITEDARWIMEWKRHEYDVIVGDLFLPWRTGQGRLFTLEHFQNVRRALKPNGVYCQWLPLFQLTRPQYDAIVRTFRLVFPDAFLVRGDFYFELPIIGLVGGREFSRIDWDRIEAACEQIRIAGQTSDPLVRHAEGVAMMMLGPAPDPGVGQINTLGTSWLEWDAGHNIIGMKTPWFLGVPCAEYVRDVQRAGMSALPERFRPFQDVGQFFLTLEVAATLRDPLKANLEQQIPMRLPKALMHDAQADFRQWPSRVKFSISAQPR